MDEKVDSLLKQTYNEFNIELDNSHIKNIASSISSKHLKMIKLVAVYTTARKQENPIQRLQILYKGKNTFDWLNDTEGDYYKLYQYYKKKLNVMLNENGKIFTLKTDEHRIDSRHPLYKQIFYEKLYHLSLLNTKNLENKLKLIKNDNFELYYKYINESIDWYKILATEDTENKNVTRIELPSIEKVLPKLTDISLNYNLDVNKLKLMKNNIDKENEINKYFKTDIMAIVKKRKVDTGSEATKQSKKQKKSKNRRVVMDASISRA